jgi:hypothetical protein
MEVFGLGLKIKEEGAATVEASIKRLGSELARTVLSVAAVTKAMTLFVRETADAQREQAQLNNALRSTNFVSGQNITILNSHAKQLREMTAATGGAIAEAQALLLTFTNIREVFPDATRMVLDMAQALGMDTRSAAMMLGKALNDPVLGVTALRRAGVQLSEQQAQLVKDLVATNKVLEAQRIILKELETQVGGSAAAYRDTLGGAIAAAKESFLELFELQDRESGFLQWTANFFNDVFRGLQIVISDTPEEALAKLDKRIGELRAYQQTFAEGTIGYATAEQKIQNLQSRINSILAKARQQAAINATSLATTSPTATGGDASSRLAGLPQAGAAISGFEARAAEQFAMVGGKLKTVVQAGIPAVSSIVLSEAARAAAELQIQIQQTFQESIANSLVGGIVGGIEQAVASGNIGEGFKAMTSMLLAGIGDAMIKFGTSTAAFSKFMAGIKQALSLGNPAAGLAMSLALIGVGAALKGAARGMFGGQSGGAAFSSASFGGGGGGFTSGLPTTQLIFGQTSATTASGMTPRQSTNVTIIGPNDPSAQRAMQELLNKANSRGSLG